MKIKCQICEKVDETYPNSPMHILKLCEEHLKWYHNKQANNDRKNVPLNLWWN